MPARCASSLPLSLPPPRFSLSRFYKRRVLYFSFFHFSLFIHSLSLSLFPSFFILCRSSSNYLPLIVFRVPTPYVFLRLFSTTFFFSSLSLWFSLSLYLSLFLSLRLCFVSFNSDRPFAKCAKRTLMGKRVKRKERGEKKRKEGWTRWLDNWAFVSSMRALSFRRRLYPHHCNVHRIFDFVAVTSGSADGIYFN